MRPVNKAGPPDGEVAGSPTGQSHPNAFPSENGQVDSPLPESEARFRAIVETTPECVKLVARDGTLLHMNSSGLEMVGADCAEAVLGRNIYEVIAPEDRARYREFNEHVCDGAKGILEFDIVGLRGVRRHMETHGAPLRNTDGTIVQLAVTRDVTGRKQAETGLRATEDRLRQANAELGRRLAELQEAAEEVRQSRRAAMNLMQDAVQTREKVEQLNHDLHREIAEREEAHKGLRQRTAQFETLLDRAPLGVFVVDADFLIRDINPMARPAFGEIRDIIGRNFDEVTHIIWNQAYADEIVRLFRHTLETGESYATPERIERRSDRDAIEYYEWRIDRIPEPDGRYGVVCYFRDISAQVRTRVAITESEERYRSLVTVITNVPWTTDAAGAFVTPQLPWQAYTGQTWAEHAGFGWVNALHPDDRERLAAEWKKACTDGTRFAARSRLWHAATLEYRHCEVQAAPLLNPDGSVREWVGSNTDNENRIRAELEIKVARDEALAANRAKDEFLATLSHELRTPLNPVLLVASEYAVDPALPETARADFKMIADNISLQARLIDDLLDLNRIAHGKVVLEQRPLDLHGVIRDAITTIQGEISAKRINLTYSLNARFPMVQGDPVRLRQVFWNVMRNAVKFTPVDGRIDITSSRVESGSELEVRIRDSGIGMAIEELSRIFQPFVQGRHSGGSRHEEFGGLGLGLAISRMLVECHKGKISAESPGPNQGTTIIVRLPVKVHGNSESAQPEDGNGPGPQAPPTREDHSVERVLFVEDHEATRNAMARLLRRRGYDVIVAHSAADALRKAEQAPFDVLISDLGLPDGDGCKLMSELRQAHPDLSGIAISGFGMPKDVSRSRAAGFDEHLTKPISIDSLERALVRLLERSKALRH